MCGPGPKDRDVFWLETEAHRAWLKQDAHRQFAFFRKAFDPEGGFYQLDGAGRPIAGAPQELHATTRMIHAFALGKCAGLTDCDETIAHGLAYLEAAHEDPAHGGFLWAVGSAVDGRKLAYGHAFVLLAASSARLAGHETEALIERITDLLDTRFWEPEFGRFSDEWARDWRPFSTYRGMNANMHGAEALLAAHEATGRGIYLERAGQILDFFTRDMAASHGWRLPEHYTEDWQIDPDYEGDPMFRPAGTTPGHAFEFARLLLQHWELSGRADEAAPARARALVAQALEDAWAPDGGLYYTVDFSGKPLRKTLYWWPVTEAIGALAALIKLERRAEDEAWYRRLWHAADAHFMDHEEGGWWPEAGMRASGQFAGKPDIYHALQAVLYPLTPGLARHMNGLPGPL